MNQAMELRNPKAELRRKSAARSPKPTRRQRRLSDFGVRACFGFRISDLGFLLLLLSPLLAGCGPKHGSAPASATLLPAAVVRVETLQSRKLPLTEEVVGTVKSRQAADIEAKVSGRITSLPVVLGQAVKEGDLLVALATQEIQARLEQAEAALRQAEIDAQRVGKLRQGGAATQSEFDSVTYRHQSAQAAVAEARAMLAYARITAPLGGVVARKDAEVGDLAMPGRPLLRLEDPTHLRLEAEVPGSMLARIKPGDTLKARVDAIGAVLEGKVAEIAPVADPATRSVRVKLDLPETAGLLPGQFGRVAVPLAEAEFLVVPAGALVQRGQLEIVFVTREGRAQMRLVRTGRPLDGGVEILSGLSAGEAVVVEGAAGLVDGQPVTTKER
jgi:membrane fusion protein, multidrug efflux system